MPTTTVAEPKTSTSVEPALPSSVITSTTTASPTTTTTTAPSQFEAAMEEMTADRLGHSWHEGCPVGAEDLRLVRLTYWGFDGVVHQGELIVRLEFAEKTIDVFQALFQAGYPVESMIPIGDLPPDAESEPSYSNTSGFNCRVVEGTNRWSEHARGLAIDLNPHLNPLVDGERIRPSGAARYADRTLDEPGMIKDGDVVVDAFRSIGWEWGGHWTSLKDYHHFSATGR